MPGTIKVLISALVITTITCFWGTNFLSLFDWDELNFAEISREMIASGDYLRPTIAYLPFNEKPPLFNWLQLTGYELFGISARGARFPNLLCAVASFMSLWWLSRNHFRGADRFLWPLFLCMSFLPALYFQSGIIDPWYNLFILLGLWKSLTEPRLSVVDVLVSGLFLGLAVLTKGPAAGLIAGVCWLVLLLRNREDVWPRALSFVGVGVLALLPIGLWLAAVWEQGGGGFAGEFLEYQWRLFLREDAGHGGFPGYHVIVLLLGCFPASWFALPKLFRAGADEGRATRGMRLLFWVVLIVFTVVNTKIVHYSSLCYLPLAWLAAQSVQRLPSDRWVRWMRGGLLGGWILYAVAAGLLASAGATMEYWLPQLNDPELLSRLSMPVSWPWYTFVPSVVALAGVGWQLRVNRQFMREGPGEMGGRWACGHLLISLVFLMTGLFTLAPRIQQYSQGAPVAFFSELKGQEVYVGTAYYKSYAHWFHAAVVPDASPGACQDRQCKFHGPTTKPLFFASPMRKTEQVLREVPDATLLKQEGGFSFYRRPPAAPRPPR